MQRENLRQRSHLSAFLGAGHRMFAGISIEMRREQKLNPRMLIPRMLIPHNPNISQGVSPRVRAARSV